MKYFKNSNNEVYAYETDGSQDDFIDKDLIEITEKEALEITNPPPSKEQLILNANATKEISLVNASEKIAPLQDAIDLGIATGNEIATLKKWKEYRVLLNRIDTSTAPDIKWPVKPE